MVHAHGDTPDCTYGATRWSAVTETSNVSTTQRTIATARIKSTSTKEPRLRFLSDGLVVVDGPVAIHNRLILSIGRRRSRNNSKNF
jgi:hypothetical protein